MEVRVLGALTLDDGRIPLAPRDRAVMGALTVRLGAALSVESLAEALWGDSLPASWSKVIPGCIMRLRRLIAPALIETTPFGYRLAPEHVEVDAEQFERLVSRGTHQLKLGEPERAAHSLAEALDLWRGEAFVELIDWGPAQIASARLEEMRLGVEELLLDALLQTGEVQEVAALARARVAEAPLRERRWVLLSVAQYRQGRQADALAAVRRARAILSADLGLDPSTELAELEQAILRQDPSLLTDHVFRAGSPECPYFGLPPAGMADAERYFGREQELAGALRALEEHGVLLVAGSSGVGKSSLVRAGIGARSAGRGTEVVIVLPGERPTEALRDLVRGPGDSLLIVDQCEQAFAADDPSETRKFFEALLREVSRRPVVVAIRADRLGDLAEHEGFAGIIQSHMLLLTAFGTDGLRDVIEKPAQQAGLILEPGLVEILVRDADGRNLPLLSHALRQVWSRREGRVLTVDGYRASGEIQGAVAKTAEEVFAGLSAEGQRLLRDILLRLVEVSADGTVISRRIERIRIEMDQAHAKIVDRLVDARLLISERETVQVSHEALAREWPRLKEWLADDIEGQRIMRHLGSAATAWEAMGRPDSELYRGHRQAAAQRWRDAASPALTPVEREFLDACAAAETAGLAATQRQLNKERSMVRRLSWATAGAAALAVVAATAGLVAGFQANLAGERAAVAEARRVAATALEEPDFDRALLLAVEARHIWDSSETRTNLVRVFSRAPHVTSITRFTDEGVTPVSMSLEKDGTRVSVIDSDDDLRLFDLADRSPLGEYSPFGGKVAATAVDPVTGTVAFSATMGLCDALPCERGRTGTLGLVSGGRSGLMTYQGMAKTAADVEYSSDGSLFAALEAASWIQPSAVAALWRVGGDVPMLLDLGEKSSDPGPSAWGGQFGALKFSPDGSRLYASRLGPTVVFDSSSGNKIDRIAGNGLLAVSPDGRLIAVRDGLLAVRIVDSSGVAAPLTVPVPVTPTVADFSPDGRQLAIPSGTSTIVVSTGTGDIQETLGHHNGAVTSAEFRSTGELVTAAADGAIMTLELGDWAAGFRTDPFNSGKPYVEELNERTLVLEEPDGSKQVVVAEPAAWEDHACRVAGRALTEREWRDLLGTRPYSPACRD
ncbi:DNA-binding SARP family transcriptional activator [Pseudarthrobacter siccitolerans]|uniref:DNA-binding SARP family transcriptional activator n=1 Tax=Pseudarthrobacter siccitolerans TaxID=861266 RepID=A0ABU0PGR6_9MICC|nr:BTAD domain-containing putative transcriptional regulator [Pseudarthrobacter siccitolerans]MDQ0673158.1 DNA-binding SARP family transcriptional activator [Pseudarthrobacter siccitolerans]